MIHKTFVKRDEEDEEDEGPPEALVRRKRDPEFKNTVIDRPTPRVLADKLRKATHRCYRA